MRKFVLVCVIVEVILSLALLTLLILNWIGLGGETRFSTERWALCGGILLLCVVTNVCRVIEDRKDKK